MSSPASSLSRSTATTGTSIPNGWSVSSDKEVGDVDENENRNDNEDVDDKSNTDHRRSLLTLGPR